MTKRSDALHTPVPPGSVWVVDDSKLELQRTCRLLDAAGYQTEAFLEGGPLLETIVGPERPDLVLLDWQMPGVSGLEVCRFLRERFDEVSLPVLMLTARGAKEDFTEGLLAGANDYVAKPYDDAELLARVRSLVRTRRQAEAIRRREALYSTTLRSIADGVITTDLEGRVTSLNHRAESLTQWQDEQALGKRFGEVFVIVEDSAHQRLVQGVQMLPMTLLRRDGSQLPIEGTAASIGEGTGLGRVVVFRDVSERHEAERAATERAQFEQKLIGIVSHDLRTPLNVVSMSSSLMLARNKLDETDARAATLIRNSGRRAARMVSDLLDFTQARLRPGLPAMRQKADLHEIGRLVLEELQVTWPEHHLRLDTSGDCTGNWDPDRIAQLMTNLVSNALKYGKPDGEVLLKTIGLKDDVRLEVHNEGNPIAAEMIPILFEPMQRGVESKADRSVGLGLFIAQDIVKAHSGSIDVTSSAQEGTTFSVRLPR